MHKILPKSNKPSLLVILIHISCNFSCLHYHYPLFSRWKPHSTCIRWHGLFHSFQFGTHTHSQKSWTSIPFLVLIHNEIKKKNYAVKLGIIIAYRFSRIYIFFSYNHFPCLCYSFSFLVFRVINIFRCI